MIWLLAFGIALGVLGLAAALGVLIDWCLGPEE